MAFTHSVGVQVANHLVAGCARPVHESGWEHECVRSRCSQNALELSSLYGSAPPGFQEPAPCTASVPFQNAA